MQNTLSEPLKNIPCSFSLERAGFYEAPQGKDFPPHQHPMWEILYFISGETQFCMGRDTLDVQPGMLIVVPPNQVHTEFTRTGYSNFYLQISTPVETVWPHLCRDNKDRTLYTLCAQIVHEFGGQLLHAQQMVDLLLVQMDILLTRELRKRDLFSAEQVVNKIDSLLRTRYTSRLTIKSLAQEVGVSPSYLRAQYKRLRGTTLMHTLQSMRLDYAVKLISTTNASLEVIAQMSGYDSASHLSRYIKIRTGKSPGTIRSADQS